MQPPLDNTAAVEILEQLKAYLEGAIEQAIQNPLLFSEGVLLREIQTQCSKLDNYARRESGFDTLGSQTMPHQTKLRDSMLSQIMSRDSMVNNQDHLIVNNIVNEVQWQTTRLQRLIASASQILSKCWASSLLSGSRSDLAEIDLSFLEYGVHGDVDSRQSVCHVSLEC